MESPEDTRRVSVIHSRPSVICLPHNSPGSISHMATALPTLQSNPNSFQKRGFDYTTAEESLQFSSPYPPHYYQHSTSSNCSETSTNSFLDWQDISSPQDIDPDSVTKMGEISPLPLLPGTPSPPLPNPKLQNHFAANKTRNEQLEMLSKKQEKVFTGSKTPKKEEFLNCSKAEKQENLFVPPTRGPAARVRNPSKRDRTRKHSSGKSDPFAFPADENSSPEVTPLKKIKLEGAAELKEKVGNKPISNCKVCGDLAVAHMHYGGVCCYSCKAFFRRATQTGKDKKYKCKSDKQCTITYTNRRSCQFCRFNKCLEIGMKPNWVLSDEQCNIRFRNVRKDGVKDGKGKTAREGSVSDPIDIQIVKEETIEVDKGLLMPFTGEESKSLEYLVDCYNQSKETYTFSEENDRLWRKLFKPESSQTSTPGGKYDYSTFDLGSLIMTVIKKNIFFVKLNEKFNELTNHDQKLILQKNMSEMCHIRGAIRFDTKSKNFVWYFSKKDQLQMAFEKKKPESGSSSSTSSSSSSSSSTKNARLSNALIGQQDMSKFYKSTTSQNIFGLVNKLCEIGLPMEVFLIMINIVLFSSDGLHLEQPQTASAAQTYFLLFLHRYLNELFGRDDARMKLSRIMGILVDLRELCERSKEEELARIKMSR